MPKKTARKRISARVVKKTPNKHSRKTTKKLIFLFLGGALALLISAFTIKAMDRGIVCANSISCIKDLSGKYDSVSKYGQFAGKTIKVPSEATFAYLNPGKKVLGENTSKKKIAVDLTNQRLYAYEGETVVMDFPVSTGKWNHTPTGNFRIWVKLRYTRMSGGSGADYYNLPNVPFTMFYYNSDVPKSAGYSIHGAYWHNNFGHPMSHGCVNMKIADAGQLFAWAAPSSTSSTTYASENEPGTEVVVYGETPTE